MATPAKRAGGTRAYVLVRGRPSLTLVSERLRHRLLHIAARLASHGREPNSAFKPAGPRADAPTTITTRSALRSGLAGRAVCLAANEIGGKAEFAAAAWMGRS